MWPGAGPPCAPGTRLLSQPSSHQPGTICLHLVWSPHEAVSGLTSVFPTPRMVPGMLYKCLLQKQVNE